MSSCPPAPAWILHPPICVFSGPSSHRLQLSRHPLPHQHRLCSAQQGKHSNNHTDTCTLHTHARVQMIKTWFDCKRRGAFIVTCINIYERRGIFSRRITFSTLWVLSTPLMRMKLFTCRFHRGCTRRINGGNSHSQILGW